jgi:hypothetical protein
LKDYPRIAKKITAVLFLVQSLSSAGFIAVFTVNALVGVELSGRPALAGLPKPNIGSADGLNGGMGTPLNNSIDGQKLL